MVIPMGHIRILEFDGSQHAELKNLWRNRNSLFNLCLGHDISQRNLLNPTFIKIPSVTINEMLGWLCDNTKAKFIFLPEWQLKNETQNLVNYFMKRRNKDFIVQLYFGYPVPLKMYVFWRLTYWRINMAIK
jgi:hypothetical protein